MRILQRHGPLSIRGLSQIIKPVIKRQRLNEVLQNLLRKKFIIKRHDRLFRGGGVFYQVNQNAKLWPEISDFISCNSSSLYQPQFRSVQYHHSEICALWANELEELFFESCVLRDYEIRRSQAALRLLISDGQEPELLPDILFLVPSQDRTSLVSVAIEIERYMKSQTRLVAKLKKFANESLLDGVIYICEDDGIVGRIGQIYTTKVRDSANRINNYGDNFLLFKDNVDISSYPHFDLKNARGDVVSLMSWSLFLSSQKPHERKDHSFNIQESCTGSLQGA